MADHAHGKRSEQMKMNDEMTQMKSRRGLGKGLGALFERGDAIKCVISNQG
jgi:hypothetical protein